MNAAITVHSQAKVVDLVLVSVLSVVPIRTSTHQDQLLNPVVEGKNNVLVLVLVLVLVPVLSTSTSTSTSRLSAILWRRTSTSNILLVPVTV
jgi:hypothetical protein